MVRDRAWATSTGRPIPAVIARWQAVDGCATPSDSTAGVVTTSIAACPSGRNIELITIAGGGHQWHLADASDDGTKTYQ